MRLFGKALMFSLSLLVAACGMLSSPFEGVNDEKVARMQLADSIKTSDLYGAWAISDEDPIDFLYLVVFMPNHMGVLYLTMDEKDGKPESVYTEALTWKFNEKTRVFTMHSTERKSVVNGKPEKIEKINEVKNYKTKMYMMDGKRLAVQFQGDGKTDNRKYIFLRMEDETYYKLVKGVPGLPRLK